MKEYNDFIIDFETLDTIPSARVAILAATVFNSNPEKDNTIEQLIKTSIQIKFNIKMQTGRTVSKSTILWIKNQSKEVQKAWVPSDEDVSLEEGIRILKEFLLEHKVNFKYSQVWCRGNSFDFPILESIARDVYPEKEFPIDFYRFFNQRDVRTRIEALLLRRGMTRPPMPKDIFKNLVSHNCMHDCIMDVMMLKFSELYARGLKDVGDDYE